MDGGVVMELRLPYRMLTMRPMIPHPDSVDPGWDMTVMQERAELEAKMIKNATIVVADEVVDFWALHDQQEWQIVDGDGGVSDTPNLAPPFPLMFITGKEPQTVKTRDGLERPQHTGERGAMICAFDTRVEKESPCWSQLIQCGAKNVNPTIQEYVASARWALMISLWTTTGAPPISGRPLWMGYMAWVFLDQLGRPTNMLRNGPTITACEKIDGSTSMLNVITTTALTIYFMHCKNIQLGDATADHSPSRKWLRRKKTDLLKHYSLSISPFRETLRKQGGIEKNGAKKALHICRGHFATYTENAPLFGKHTGVFFRPQHTRGHQSHGEVKKDYQVGSPK